MRSTPNVGESVGMYARNFKLMMLKELLEEVRPLEYHQMIKFKKGLLDPFKLLIVIQDCVGLDKLIESAKTLEAEVVMTSGKELSSGLTRGLVTHKPGSKFMAEYHEQLGDKVKIREVAEVEAKDVVEAARESSEEVIKALKRKLEEQDEKISCLEKRQETDKGNNSGGNERFRSQGRGFARFKNSKQTLGKDTVRFAIRKDI